MDNGVVWTVTTWIFPVLLNVVLHELAHGWVAFKLGDNTAKNAGRITMNPLAHIDWVGTVLVPAVLLMSGSKFLFGWAKPVPVRFDRLKHPKRDMGLVAAAGPLANLILAIFLILLWHVLGRVIPVGDMYEWAWRNVLNGVGLAMALCVFNLIPILPLDGGRIVASILPVRWSYEWQKTERYGFFVVIGLIVFAPGVIRWYTGHLYPVFEGILRVFM